MAKIEQLEDGKKVRVETSGGEAFEGDDWLTATQKLAEAKEAANQKIREQKEEIERLKAPKPVEPPPAQTETVEQKQLRSYLTGELAADLGLKPEQLKALPAIIASQQEEIKASKVERAILTFQDKYREFPNTDAANEAITERVRKDFRVDVDDVAAEDPVRAANLLGAAHMSCVRDGVYKPLTIEEQNASWANNMAAASRPQAPPIIRSGSPDANQGTTNEWTEPIDQLRARVIREQLGQGRAS